MQMHTGHHTKSRNNVLAFISLLAGISLGLFVYTYLLIDFFPPLSKTIFALTAVITLAGSAGYFFIFSKLITPALSDMTRALRVKMFCIFLLMSLLVVWFGLEGVLPDSRYLVFLLPRQSLQISVPQPQEADLKGSRISWIKTSLGELSFNTLDYEGWERADDALVLVDPFNNHLTWSGHTGKEALIVFKISPAGGYMIVSWNGVEEEINLFFAEEGELIHRRQFQTPFYASRIIPLLFGIFNIFAGLFAVSALIWRSIRDHKIDSAAVRASMAGSGWQRDDLILMFGLAGAALLLRTFNLENLYPFTDEYSHLLAVKNILGGMPLNQVYQRSLAIVTLPAALFIKIFGAHIWAARLATVLFNSLAVIPLYLITRRINRPVAVIAGLLFSTSPWVIAVARNIREYGYYPYYFFWILYAMFLFLERVPDKFVLARDWKKVINPAMIALLLLLAFPVFYSKYIDLSSTFRTVLPAYFVFSFFLLKKLDWKNKANIYLILVIFVLIVLGYKVFLNRLRISPNFFGNLSAFQGYFLKISPFQWFFEKPPALLGFVLGAALLMAFYLRKNTPYPLFFLILFCTSALLFIMNFNHDYRPRYYFHLEVWYIPLVALGVYGLWLALKLIIISAAPRLPARHSILQNVAAAIAALALLLNVNLRQALLPTFHKENGFMPITTEYHYDLQPLHEYMLAHASKEDVLIYTIYGSYAQWVGEPQFARTFYYAYRREDKQEFILSLVDQYPSGWIVIDKWKGVSNERLLPFKGFSRGGKEVAYLGEFIDEYVWRWEEQE